jgi:hypothetical protein
MTARARRATLTPSGDAGIFAGIYGLYGKSGMNAHTLWVVHMFMPRIARAGRAAHPKGA